MSEKRKDKKGRLLRNGETQRSDGKYMFRYTDQSGTRRAVYSWKLVDADQVPAGKRCEISLRALEKQIERDLRDGIYFAEGNSTTVDDIFEAFMAMRTDLKVSTRCNYFCLYNTYAKRDLGDLSIRKIRPSDIQRLYLHMATDLKLKASTIRSVHIILYQSFEISVMDCVLRVNPCANAMKTLRKVISMEQDKRHALTETEQTIFIDYVYKSKTFNRWGALLTVLLGTGMRIGEALGLTWSDCDFEKDQILVSHTILYKPSESGGYEYRISEPKTKAGLRTIPMFSDVKKALLSQREKQSRLGNNSFKVGELTGFIFLNNNGRVFTPASVFDAIQNVTSTYNHEEQFKAKKEGREPVYLPKISAHILRHTFCTRLCEHEAEIQNLKVVQDVMGHKNIRTTMDVYNEATETVKAASFRNLDGKIKIL